MQTVGVLVALIGCVLLFAAFRGNWSIESLLQGMLSAIGLAAVDCLFVVRRIIPPIYLLDAAAELLLLIGWLVGLLSR